MGNFKQEDLIRYLYNETSESKSSEIHSALQTDENLREEFELLNLAQRQLDTVHFSPAPDTIQKIMQHAYKSVETNS